MFTRSGRTLSLTEAGQAYHAYFQQCRFQLDLLKNRLEEPKKDGKPTIRIAYPEDVDPSYFRDKIQNAAAAMRTPVRLEFSCYPEAELTNLLTDGKIDLILTGTRPDEAASHCPGTHFSRFHRFCFTHQPAPKPRIFPTFEMTPSSFPKPMPPWKSSQNLYPLFQDLGFAPKTVLQPIYPQSD